MKASLLIENMMVISGDLVRRLPRFLPAREPREGRVRADLVPCNQDDPGAHSCQRYRGYLTNPGRATRDDNSLPSHRALFSNT